MKSEKPKWFFNKFLKAKYENKKKILFNNKKQ